MMKTFAEGVELPTTKEGLKRLQAACHIFTALSGEGVHAKVREIWCDYGAGLWYKQIVIYRNAEETDSFQISPNSRERIMRARNRAEIIHEVLKDMEGYPRLYGID